MEKKIWHIKHLTTTKHQTSSFFFSKENDDQKLRKQKKKRIDIKVCPTTKLEPRYFVLKKN